MEKKTKAALFVFGQMCKVSGNTCARLTRHIGGRNGKQAHCRNKGSQQVMVIEKVQAAATVRPKVEMDLLVADELVVVMRSVERQKERRGSRDSRQTFRQLAKG